MLIFENSFHARHIIDDGEYHIIVAAHREEPNIAGIIGYQYGLYLKHYYSREQDHEEAIKFAKIRDRPVF